MTELYWQDVRKHQINLSISKSTYAFPRDKRFRSSHKVLCDSFYNIPSSIGKTQKCGIGLGNKMSLVTNNQSPSPNKYNIASDFDPIKRNMSMGKFALGRQQIKYNGIFRKSQTPEPGHYQIRTDLSSSRGILMHSKLIDPKYSNQKNPGPGQYNSITTMNKTGKYIVSNMLNCPGTKITNSRMYDPSKSRIVPGPGAYQTKQNLNNSGRYFNSKFEGSRSRTFSKSAKNEDPKLESKKKLPGPGAYNFFSEFGLKIRK